MTKKFNASQGHDSNAIHGWLVNEVSLLLAKPASEIRTDRSIFEFGIDSSAAIGLSDMLAEFLDRDVDPKIFYDHPTIDGLSNALASHGGGK
jgi:acyl carrier protein